MGWPEHDRRKEDRFLSEVERRIGEIESILRFDVVRKSGPWAERFERLESAVREISNTLATKTEIESALRDQTRTLKASKQSKFTRREKTIGLLIAAGLFGLDLVGKVFGI